MKDLARCGWADDSEMMRHYHDTEWGVPVHDDRKLFEFLILDGFQAGLSWSIILKKREAFRAAFDQFDPRKVACYDERKIASLLENAGIVRNRLKINATITNARAFLEVQKAFGSFDAYFWSFVDGKMIVNSWETLNQIPAVTREAEIMSKDLKQRGFKFVGPTICYAVMQSAGLVNDHLVSCFRYREVQGLA